MKIRALQHHGITVIEGQVYSYEPNGDVHKRSYMCAKMSESLFKQKIEPHLASYSIRYLLQSNTLWDLREFGGLEGEIWVTKVRGVGSVRIHLLEDEIDLEKQEVYVVMWRRRFLPRFFRKARCLDIDRIILSILNGRTRPPLFARHIIRHLT
jgi:hypothetical protein